MPGLEPRGMLLSIVVVSWNTCDLLVQCLQSVYGTLEAWTISCEVIVVDNASMDDSVQAVRRRFPGVVLIENPVNVGFARANNQAIERSEGQYVLLLNPDTVVQPGAIQGLLHFMDTHPQAGAVAPKLVNPDASFQASWARFPTLLSEFFLMTGLARVFVGPYAPSPRPQPQEAARFVDWVAGAALLVRQSAVDQVGALDERYFLYSEETEWCWRLWQGGWEVWYLPDVAIVHYGGASTRKLMVESYVQLYASKVRFFTGTWGLETAQRLRIMLIVVSCFRLVLWILLGVVCVLGGGGRSMRKRFRREMALLRWAWAARVE